LTSRERQFGSTELSATGLLPCHRIPKSLILTLTFTLASKPHAHCLPVYYLCRSDHYRLLPGLRIIPCKRGCKPVHH
jgi:hypothetical protein